MPGRRQYKPLLLSNVAFLARFATFAALPSFPGKKVEWEFDGAMGFSV
jgi:hypothetical protein